MKYVHWTAQRNRNTIDILVFVENLHRYRTGGFESTQRLHGVDTSSASNDLQIPALDFLDPFETADEEGVYNHVAHNLLRRDT